jgi:hypothetical protein
MARSAVFPALRFRPEFGITPGLTAIGKLRGLPFVTIATALTDDFPALFGS